MSDSLGFPSFGRGPPLMVVRRKGTASSAPAADPGNAFLLATGDWLALETGDTFAREAVVAPVITIGLSFNVLENCTVGTTVGTVTLSTGVADTFAITAGNTGTRLAINNSGVITTIAAIDYETLASYSLTVQATNAGGTDSKTVAVSVTNMIAPTVTASQSFSVAENVAIGTGVGTVAVTGYPPDTFAITAGNTGSAFAIGSTGTITVLNTLDYETLTTYALTITATNAEGTSPGVTVTVNVTDVVESTLLLDTLNAATQVAGAWALRKVRAAYAGSCIRVRRSSDSTEQDIGFSGNNLDTGALATFVPSGDGAIVTWYDQSAAGNNLTSPDVLARIVIAGVLQTVGSKAAYKVDTNTHYMGDTSVALASATKAALIQMVRATATDDYARMGAFITGGADHDSTARCIFAYWSPSNTLVAHRNSATVSESAAVALSTSYAVSTIFDGTNGQIFVNGTGATAGASSGSFTTPASLRYGAASDLAVRGYYGEFYLLSNVAAGDRAAIESSIRTQYGF